MLGSGAFRGAPFPSPRDIDDSSTQGIIPRPFSAAVNAFYWASINSHAPTKQARILQAGRVIGYGIDSAALPDTLPTRWHRSQSSQEFLFRCSLEARSEICQGKCELLMHV